MIDMIMMINVILNLDLYDYDGYAFGSSLVPPPKGVSQRVAMKITILL